MEVRPSTCATIDEAEPACGCRRAHLKGSGTDDGDTQARVMSEEPNVATPAWRHARDRGGADILVRLGGSTASALKTWTKRSLVKNELGDRVNAARLEYTHGTLLGNTTTTRGHMFRPCPRVSARSGGRALKQQSFPRLRVSGGWTTRG